MGVGAVSGVEVVLAWMHARPPSRQTNRFQQVFRCHGETGQQRLTGRERDSAGLKPLFGVSCP